MRADLEGRGHVVHTPDLPCEDVTAGVEEYAVIRPDRERHLARDVLGVEPLELAAGHSPMLERPRELAMLLEALV